MFSSSAWTVIISCGLCAVNCISLTTICCLYRVSIKYFVRRFFLLAIELVVFSSLCFLANSVTLSPFSGWALACGYIHCFVHNLPSRTHCTFAPTRKWAYLWPSRVVPSVYGRTLLFASWFRSRHSIKRRPIRCHPKLNTIFVRCANTYAPKTNRFQYLL